MKLTIYVLTLALGLFGCSTQTNEKKVEITLTDSTQNISTSNQLQDIYIKDKSKYDKSFINGLARYNEPMKLIDNYIIVGNHTTYFPEDLNLNERTTFTSLNDNRKYLLIVTRTNLTNIKYEFQLLDQENNIIESKSGQAILGSGFFLAPEGEPDLETGVSFISQEYRIENNNYWLVIKIGMDKDFEGKKRAKIIYGPIEESKMTGPVMESPILRKE